MQLVLIYPIEEHAWPVSKVLAASRFSLNVKQVAHFNVDVAAALELAEGGGSAAASSGGTRMAALKSNLSHPNTDYKVVGLRGIRW